MSRHSKYSDEKASKPALKQGAARARKMGLRRAQMDGGVCRAQHAQYRAKLGFVYCPWCAEELTIKHHCEHCNRDFVSDESYVMHRQYLEFYKNNPCPNWSLGERVHPSKWLKNRQRFYCPICRIEYAQQDTKEAA